MEKINLTDFQKRKLNEFYVVVYVVTKYVKIRTETCSVDKELYVLFGVDITGNRHILGIFLNNENNSRFWLEKFEDFQCRNLKKILFFVTPSNKNIERCIKIIYNDVEIVHSPDDIVECISKFLAYRPSRKTQIALKELFLAEDIDRYKMDLEIFKNIYVDNTIILTILDKKQNEIEKYYSYNQDLRKLFYPYYTIREMKKFLNKLKTKDPLCKNLNEVAEFCLEYVDSFEKGRTYSKKEWLGLIDFLYDKYKHEMEEYIYGKEGAR